MHLKGAVQGRQNNTATLLDRVSRNPADRQMRSGFFVVRGEPKVNEYTINHADQVTD